MRIAGYALALLATGAVVGWASQDVQAPEIATIRVTSDTSPVRFSAFWVWRSGEEHLEQATPFELEVDPQDFHGAFRHVGGDGQLEVEVSIGDQVIGRHSTGGGGVLVVLSEGLRAMGGF